MAEKIKWKSLSVTEEQYKEISELEEAKHVGVPGAGRLILEDALKRKREYDVSGLIIDNIKVVEYLNQCSYQQLVGLINIISQRLKHPSTIKNIGLATKDNH